MVEKQYNKLLKRISQNIKKLRAKSGYTQEDMVSFGFEYRFYQRIESGKHSMSLHTLLRLAIIFKVDVVDLMKK